MNSARARLTPVDIRSLKPFARKLPRDSSLRNVLVAEKDQMDATEFLHKLEIWLKLLAEV